MEILSEWHRIVREGDAAALDTILARDCVFLSPVVHKPQLGSDLTCMYLGAAMAVFNDSFHYTREVVQAPHAVLEFECEVDGILVNGVDIITVNDEGLISEFRVMVRPRKGMEMLQQKMFAMLEALADAQTSEKIPRSRT